MISSDELSFIALSQISASSDVLAQTRANRPNKYGCVHLCSPPIPVTELPPSICFRYNINESVLECMILIENDIHILGRENIQPLNSPIFQISCSFDARLLVVVTMDGTLICYDVLTQKDIASTSVIFHKRWSMNIYKTDMERLQIAAMNHPVRSIEFAPSSHLLLLVDALRGNLYVIDAQVVKDSISKIILEQTDWNIFLREEGGSGIVGVGAASWCPTDNNSDINNKIAVGAHDGSCIAVVQHSYTPESGYSSLQLHTKLSVPSSLDSESWTCTHLHWFQTDEVILGLSRRHGDDADLDYALSGEDDNKDDDAPHEAKLYICNLSTSQWTDMREVVPFFGVPARGRHVFYTCHMNLVGLQCLVTLSNVSSDVGIICKTDSDDWNVWDLQDGNQAMMPITSDDEFTFPIGVIPVTRSQQVAFACQSTNGTTKVFLPKIDGEIKAGLLLPRSGLRARNWMEALHDSALSSTSTREKKPSHPVDPKQDNLLFQASTFSLPSWTQSLPSENISTLENAPKPFANLASPTFGLSSTNPGSFLLGSMQQVSIADSMAPGKYDLNRAYVVAPVFGFGASQPYTGGFSALAKQSPQNEDIGFASTPSISSLSSKLEGTAREGLLEICEESFSEDESEDKNKSASFVHLGDLVILSNSMDSSVTIDPNNHRYRDLAGSAFDTVDTDKVGTVPLSKFEQLLDLLGEGFFGEELEAQRRSVHCSQTGQVDRESFISWYKSLVEENSKVENDDVSIDSEERAERLAERVKAERMFSSLASVESNRLNKGDFGKLMEAMGTTYCEEEHRRTVKKLSESDGTISKDTFVRWYVDWLYKDDDDSDYESDEDESISEDGTNKFETVDEKPAAGWGDLFLQADDIWKCNVCMINNDGNLRKCAACEAVHPGLDKDDSSSTAKISTLENSIRPTSDGTVGFTFSAANAPTSSMTSAVSAPSPFSEGFKTSSMSSGFSFQWTTSNDDGSITASNVSTGSKMNAPKSTADISISCSKASEKTSSSIFNSVILDEVSSQDFRGADPNNHRYRDLAGSAFDAVDTDKVGTVPLSKFEQLLDLLGEGFFGEELEAQRRSVHCSQTGQVDRESFISWYKSLVEENSKVENDDVSIDSEERAERLAECVKAERMFSSLASVESNRLNKGDFGKLMEAMGTTYCEEEHRRTVKKLSESDGTISKDTFVRWYVDWLYKDDDGSDYESDEDESISEDGTNKFETVDEKRAAGWGDLFLQADDIWKCNVCMINNDGNLRKCAACEAVHPGLDKDDSSSTAKISTLENSIRPTSDGTVGFTFSAANAPTSSMTSAVSAPSPFSEGFKTSSMSSGFSFQWTTSNDDGSITASNVSTGSKMNAPKSTADISISCSKASEKTSSSIFNSVILDEVSSQDFRGADPNNHRYRDLAGSAFDAVDTDKVGTVPLSKFEQLLDLLGEGFFGEELEAQRRSVHCSQTGQVDRESFISWYKSLVEENSKVENDDVSIDSEERAERLAECVKAERMFSSLASVESNRLNKGDFGKLMEAMGTTYCEEEHRRTVKKLSESDGTISKDTFVRWYVDWLYKDDDGSDYESDEDESISEDGTNKFETVDEKRAAGWGDLFLQADDIWKCNVCMINNDGNLRKCAACEAVHPGLDKDDSSSTAKISTLENSIRPTSDGTVGFTFSAANAPTSSMTSAVSAPSPFSEGFKTSSMSSGFSFQWTTSNDDGSITASNVSTGSKMNALAPSSADTNKEKVPSSSAYSPLSAKAPTPFSAFSSDPNKEKVSSSSAYPPMSAKAPTPFSASSSDPNKEKVPSSSAYPPMSAKAPTPFSASSSDPNKEKVPSSSAYPPMSAKAPTPFSASSSDPNKEKVPSSSAYPPMSAKAPTPFSASSSDPNKEKVPSSSAYPPLSAKAPTPFSASSSDPNKEKVPSSSSDANKEKVPSSSAYPPMSAKAPTPFSASSSDPNKEKVPSLSAFPPMSAKAPTPFSASSSDPNKEKVSSSSSDANKEKVPSSSAYPPMSASARAKTNEYLASTGYEHQFWLLVNDFIKITASLRKDICESQRLTLKNDFDKMCNAREKIRGTLDPFHDDLDEWNNRIHVLLGVNEDVSRRVNEAQQLSNYFSSSASETDRGIRMQPLDAESEKQRRQLQSQSITTSIKLRNAQHTLQLLEKLLSSVPANKGLRQSTPKTGKSTAEGNIPLFQTLKINYDRIRQLESSVSKVRRDMENTKIRVFTPMDSNRASIKFSPKIFDSPFAQVKGPLPQGGTLELQSIVKACQKINESSSCPSVRTFYRRQRAWKCVSPVVSHKTQTSVMRGDASIMTTLSSPSVDSDIFGKPKRSLRIDWKSEEISDQKRLQSLKLEYPVTVKEVDVADAQRLSLKSFNTTYEKVQETQEIKRRGESDSVVPGKRTQPQELSSKLGSKLHPTLAGDETSDTGKTLKVSNVSSNNKNTLVNKSGVLQKSVLDLKSLDQELTSSNISVPHSIKSSENTFAIAGNTGETLVGPKHNSFLDSSNTENQMKLSFSSAGTVKSHSSIIESSSGSSMTTAMESSHFRPQEKSPLLTSSTAFSASQSSSLPFTPVTPFGSESGRNLITHSLTESKAFNAHPIESLDTSKASYGKTPREILQAVYEKYNPSKLGEIDKVLLKYAGQEDLLLRNLAKKYNISHSDLGIQDDINVPGTFGARTPLGFGSSSNSSVSPGFGSLAQMGHSATGFGANFSTVPSSGAHGFGSSVFGGNNSTVSFASFGGPVSSTTPAFGTSTPFGAPRR